MGFGSFRSCTQSFTVHEAHRQHVIPSSYEHPRRPFQGIMGCVLEDAGENEDESAVTCPRSRKPTCLVNDKL